MGCNGERGRLNASLALTNRLSGLARRSHPLVSSGRRTTWRSALCSTGMNRAAVPSMSIVIELANIRQVDGDDRFHRMFVALCTQLRSITTRSSGSKTFQVLIAFDETDRDEGHFREISQVVEREVSASLDVSLVGTPSDGYFEMKNAGAELAQAEIILFLDSDVIPEDGCVERLLESFDDPALQVVCGSSYVETDGIWAKAFGLMWFLRLREPADGVFMTNHFHANCVAFRRSVFSEFGPFPIVPGTSRGACLGLARRLSDADVAINMRAGARVAHPALRPADACRRALVQGNDTARRSSKASALHNVKGTTRRYVRFLATTAWAVGGPKRRLVGLPVWAIPFAMSVGLGYYTLAFVSELATYVRIGVAEGG